MTALSSPLSASMRSIAASASSLAVTSPERTRSAWAVASRRGSMAASVTARTSPVNHRRKPDRVLVLSLVASRPRRTRTDTPMEPLSTEPQAPARRGRKGSLENPEVLENVPGHIIPILEREFDDFDNEAEKYLGGGTPEDQFIGFRLKQGVYGQRQADVQMIRVKLPFGGITPEQMDAFASVVEKYAPLNKGHITTRQNIQLHHIPLTDAAKAIRELSDSGLSSREGCGNTVRNVTGDPWAGVCEGELFDPTPYV